MRENRGLLIGVGVAAIAVGLIAVNLASREDPEPSSTAPRTPVAEREPEDDEPVRPSTSTPGSRPTTSNERPSEPSVEAPAEPPSEAESSAACAHPFVPSAIGEWRRYSWRQSDEERTAELRMEAVRARTLDDGQHEITWRVSVTASDDASQLAEARMAARCVPGEQAEEPWFGILERSLGLRLTDEPGRWRWPVSLRTGQRFDGTASFDPTGADMRIPAEVLGPQMLRVTRNHVVGEREPIEVPAGRFRAHRVDYEEQHAFGSRGEHGTGTIWVAPDVGMVMSRAENSQGVVQTIELLALGRRSSQTSSGSR
jgi:hypothetical protein